MWKEFKKDFKERFLTYETLKGVYFVFAGPAMIYIAMFYERYAYKATAIIFGWYIACEGLRKIQVNRVKQAAVKRKMVAQRLLDQ